MNEQPAIQADRREVRARPRAHEPRAPGEWILVFGVVYPAVVIGIELASRMCAEAFFDPMPTYWHVLGGRASSPRATCWSGRICRTSAPRSTKWLAFANGAAIAIAGFYALLFLPLLPIALVGIVVGIGLLPLAPLASFVCALRLRAALHDRARRTGRPTARSSAGWPPASRCCLRSTSRRPQRGSASNGRRAACRRSASEG